jgi:V8-like Glu-specific endopeptidase
MRRANDEGGSGKASPDQAISTRSPEGRFRGAAAATGTGRKGSWPGRRKDLALALAVLISASIGTVTMTPLRADVQALAASLTAKSQSILQQAGLGPAALDQAKPFDGTPAVGALFTLTGSRTLGSHFCTASVVDSPGRDLLITAAHCVSGAGRGPIAFVPGFHDGREPFGVWRITRVVVDRTWASSADPDDDVAFLVVAGRGQVRIQDLTGGERLSVGWPARGVVKVIGYPGGGQAPIVCQNRVLAFSPTQLQFDCGGYTDGTSGSPLLEDANVATGLGTVIGVIGGYEQGGYTSSVSYAARFGRNVAALYQTAMGHG